MVHAPRGPFKRNNGIPVAAQDPRAHRVRGGHRSLPYSSQNTGDTCEAALGNEQLNCYAQRINQAYEFLKTNRLAEVDRANAAQDVTLRCGRVHRERAQGRGSRTSWTRRRRTSRGNSSWHPQRGMRLTNNNQGQHFRQRPGSKLPREAHQDQRKHDR